MIFTIEDPVDYLFLPKEELAKQSFKALQTEANTEPFNRWFMGKCADLESSYWNRDKMANLAWLAIHSTSYSGYYEECFTKLRKHYIMRFCESWEKFKDRNKFCIKNND